MKFKLIFTLIIFACSANIFCKSDKPEYDFAKINPNLLKDAKAIIRSNSVRFEVISERKAYETVKVAVTILCKEARKQGAVALFYNKFKKIDDFEGAIYNAKGEKVSELESDDIKDYSACNESELSSDTRVKVAELYYDSYPYTVEFEYTLYYKGYLNWPEWVTQPTLEPVEYNRFEVLIDKSKELRYWCNTDTIKPQITLNGNYKSYVWEAAGLPKLNENVVGNEEIDYAGIIKIAPDDFEIDGFSGNMVSWKGFGSWFYSLYKNKDLLPENARKEVSELINQADDTYTKVKKIYAYMQKRTRYVSIQLGIGGWMPLDAAFVHEKGYGDCKALVNYTKALLKYAGIESFPVLIYNGKSPKPLVVELPSNQFNHVVLCVPVKSDTLWLECTSQFMPINLIHSGIINRSALLVNENGGQIIQTPQINPENNTQIRCSIVSLASDGNAEATLTTQWKGIPQIGFIEMYQNSSPQERERWIQEEADIPNLNLKDFDVKGVHSPDSTTSLTANMALPKYASVSGKRLFFLPNLTERRKYIPPEVKVRLAPIRFSYPYRDIDTVIFSIPDGFIPESLPGEVKLETAFGKYHSRTSVNEDKITYTRLIEISSCKLPPAEYKAYRDFMASIVKADKAQVILVKKQ